MRLAPLDIVIILGYLLSTILIGFILSKRASKNLQAYFLGGNNIPWYFLGLSNASGMFDISGTMWTVAICFIYGLKSAWIPWLWPVWNQIFIMIFLALWLRRSKVMTGAEWITTRFGTGQGARLSHMVVVLFAVVSVIAFMAYFFEGIGKFATTFFPWDLSASILGWHISSEDSYALIIIGVTTLYTIKGGMFSVVGTEVLQFIIMTISCLVIAVIAMTQVSAEQIDAAIPLGWKELFFGWTLDLDWSGILDAANTKIENDGFSLFGFLVMMMIFKGVWASLAGPVPSYDMQRILATRSPREAAKMSGLTPLVLYFPRYLMVAGLTVMALVFFMPQLRAMGENIDFELILPYAISEFVPAGFKGLLLAGLLAAFMSTFAAFLNAAPAYLVNDIYKRYINPHAQPKRYVVLSYLASFVIVAIGLAFGFIGGSIDDMTKWIVSSLYGGYTAANVLKWIWWRFNGYGYFWGMLSGLAGTFIVPLLLPGWSALNAFPVLLAMALAGSIIACLLTPAESDEVLKKFYADVRPWGFWRPIHRKVVAENPDFRGNHSFGRDLFNVIVGMAWQMTLVVMPIYLVIKEYVPFLVGVLIFAVTSFVLKKNWLDKLED